MTEPADIFLPSNPVLGRHCLCRDHASRYAGLQPSLDVPRDVLGVGLGCWIDSRTNGTATFDILRLFCLCFGTLAPSQISPPPTAASPSAPWRCSLPRYPALDADGSGSIPDVTADSGIHVYPGTWNLTPESAKARLCMLANQSVEEIDMFVLKQGAGPDKASFPEPFWIEPLEAFMRGGGCNAAIPAPAKCPNASVGPPYSWAVSSADVGCCVASSRRGRDPGVKCDVSCAEAECAAASMFWRPENYTTHPYECCLKPTPPISPSSPIPARGSRARAPTQGGGV